MNHALRLAAAAALLVGLSGCNVVLSDEPWFTTADAQGAPKMRDGLWRNDDPDCRFDDSKPAERWPECADPSFQRGGEAWSMRWKDSDERGRHRRTFAGWEQDRAEDDVLFVANGDHLIVQLAMQGQVDEPSPGEVHDEAEPPKTRVFNAYGAVLPVRRDEDGNVTAMETWAVQCGPLPEATRSAGGRRGGRNAPEERSDSVTDRPFPGLTVAEQNCTAESVEALRRAAVLSASLGDHNRYHWVRDGWR